MEYVCKVGTPTGEVVERTFRADNEAALRRDLEQQGLYLFQVKGGLALSALALRRRKVAPDRLLLFAQELAALLKAGLPLVQSLEVTMERQVEPLFRRSLTTASRIAYQVRKSSEKTRPMMGTLSGLPMISRKFGSKAPKTKNTVSSPIMV